jgi:hypothetical protein
MRAYAKITRQLTLGDFTPLKLKKIFVSLMRMNHFLPKILVTLLLVCQFSSALHAQKEFPKLMQVIEGQQVHIRWESDGNHYYTWNNKPLANFTLPSGPFTLRYQFVDSTGKNIGNEAFDAPSSFMDGLAVIQRNGTKPNDENKYYAVLDLQGRYLFPFSNKVIENMYGGFVKISTGDSSSVYNVDGKKVLACTSCDFRLSSAKRNLYQLPRPYSRNPALVKLYDTKGKFLFQKAGYNIHYITNNVPRNNEPFSYELPMHQITLDSDNQLFAIVSDQGELLADSVGNFVFNYGIACLRSSGKSAYVVDTAFRVILPPTLGYSRYWPMYAHPKQAFAAWRNDSVMIIDRNNNYLIKPMQADYAEFDGVSKQFDIRNNSTGYRWVLSQNGDTIASPSRYMDYSELRPLLPGAIVTCKADGLKGYVNDVGKTLIPCQYDQLVYMGGQRFVYFKGTQAGYLNLEGKNVLNVDSALILSNFSEGYAAVGVKQSAFSMGAQRVISADEAYSVVYHMIDSTGKMVSNRPYDEIGMMKKGYCRVRLGTDVFMVNSRFEALVTKEGNPLISYFCKGTALILNPKTNKMGLVNEKLETLLPAIYDWIDTVEEEGQRYGFSLADKSSHLQYSDGSNPCANIPHNTIRVRLNEKEMVLELKIEGK